MRPRPVAKVVAAVSRLERPALSVITVEEVLFGLALKPSVRMEDAFEILLSACEILGVTEKVARRAAVMRGSLGARGRVRHQADMLIAATVAEHGATLVTRNVRDFDGCGIRVVDPFA